MKYSPEFYRRVSEMEERNSSYKDKALSIREGLFIRSLAMTYFHTGNRTIIGAGSFHCPVRDGKEWDQTAMAAKHKLSNWNAF